MITRSTVWATSARMSARDEDRSAFVGEPAEEIAQPVDAFGVETVCRLIQDEYLRLAQERGREAQSLAHAERELTDTTIRRSGETDELEHLLDAPTRHAPGERVDTKVIACAATWIRARGLKCGAD